MSNFDIMITRFDANPEFGQMVPEERKALYDLTIKNKCTKILEVGTWKGVGSTYILASAAKANGGHLYSIENDKANHDIAEDIYNTDLSFLKVYVCLILGDSTEKIKEISKEIQFDMVFLDGAEDGERTFNDFNLVKNDIKIVACHDWFTKKTEKIRPYLESSKDYEQISLIETSPTGFSAFKRVKRVKNENDITR